MQMHSRSISGVAGRRSGTMMVIMPAQDVTSLRVVCSTDSKLSLRKATMRAASQVLTPF
jgi:hypothetical protein